MSHATAGRHRSLLGLDARLVTLAGYLAHLLISVGKPLALFAWLVPIAIFLAKKRSQYGRSPAAQASVLNRDGLFCWLVIGILRDQLAMTEPTASRSLVFLASLALVLTLLRMALILANAIAAIQALETGCTTCRSSTSLPQYWPEPPAPVVNARRAHLKAAGASPSSKLRHSAIF